MWSPRLKYHAKHDAIFIKGGKTERNFFAHKIKTVC